MDGGLRTHVVGHGLEARDEVGEGQASVNVAVEAGDPSADVFFVQEASAREIFKEHAQVVSTNLTMRKLIDSPEDRQDRVVKLVVQLLL